ncbi:MAG: class I adenylate-forming enzyme family protein, partial [Burkholderiaceae bacterium]
SYAQLAAGARAVAASLETAGLGANEPVHVQVSNQPNDWAALFGVWLAGGVAVPVHRTTPPAVAATLQQRTLARYTVDLPAGPVAVDALSTLAEGAPAPRPLLDSAAFVIFTSGSTGVPKGVVVSHEAFHGKIEQIDTLLEFTPRDRTLLVLNITFSFGLWVSLLTLLRGGRLVMSSRFEPEAFLNELVGQHITRVGMVPTMMRVLFSDARHEAAMARVTAQAELRQILIGGESLGLSLATTIRQRFANSTLIDIYGLTETATCDFFAFPEDFASHPGCIGRPSPQVRYRIVDADGEAVTPGEIGELQIRSPYLMKGYLDDPGQTAAAYRDGWFKTGDIGRVLDGQVVELMGRQKEVISRGGNKVTPVEIEQAVCAHGDVAAAMAVGVADALLGERIHVLVVLRNGAGLDLAGLRLHLEPRLERYKHPDAYYLAPALPLGRTGKADRGRFKALIASGELMPTTPSEHDGN